MDEGNYGIEKIIRNKKIILPVDVVVEGRGKILNKKADSVEKEEIILDNGKESTKALGSYIKKSRFDLWNGPLGKYEGDGAGATKEILKVLAKSKAISIIGGGDTVSLISEMKLEKKFTFVSTGGGATLDFLANGTLPGIEALK